MKTISNSILVIFLVSALSFTACGNNAKKGDEATKTATTEVSEAPSAAANHVIQMDKQMFIDKVFDYTNSKEWKYKGDKPCIIDFYADWCRPCKMIAPILESLADKYKEDIYIYKIDTEVQRELAAAFGIRSIPSVLFCPMEGQPQMTQGALPKDQYEQIINEHLIKK